MILVFGGAYQGKKAFVQETFGYADEEIYTCPPEKTALDFSKPVIASLNEYILACLNSGLNPINLLSEKLDALQGKIIIVQDISCGLVPMGKEARLYRDNTGKIMQILSKNAKGVYRVFAGIGDQLK